LIALAGRQRSSWQQCASNRPAPCST
jgi:hypothetical protein